MSIRIDLTFPHSYQVTEIHLPSSNDAYQNVHYFPSPYTTAADDWQLAAEITTANNDVWIGVFADGYNSPISFEGILSTPDPDRILVVVLGQPYLVPVHRPADVDHLQCFPVTQVFVEPSHGLIALADFTGVSCVGKHGLSWVNKEIASDDVRILGIENGIIRVQGFVAPRNADVEFEIDAQSGKVLSCRERHSYRTR